MPRPEEIPSTAPAVRDAAESTPRTSPAAKPGFRPDIQGLRAIAVLLVVLFHSGVETLSGGYVGVDVFFVISGFLITTHLLETLARDGRISFGAFYAKRARRILPAALLVATLTLVAAWIWMSPLLMRSVVSGAIATALYVPNVFFALEDTDYLAETTPSVFQHYWSLGIEEQFYLLWPALLAVGFWLCRRRERHVMVLVAAVTAASFLAGVAMMGISEPWAFFSLPTRAWELGVGGLVAFLLRSGARWLRWRRTGLLAWAGLAGIVATALTFDEGTAFPGWIAVLPVLATAAMIIGGAAPGNLHATALLSVRPDAVPRRDLLFAVPGALAAAGDPAGGRLRGGAAAAEHPARARRGGRAAGVAAAPVRGATGDRMARAAGAFAVADGSGGGRRHAGGDRDVDRSARSVSQRALASERTTAPAQQEVYARGITVRARPNLSPALDQVAEDNPPTYADGCHRREAETDPSGCRVGENEEAPLVFLLGDSHAAAWFPALEQLAAEGKIRLDSNTKNSCLPLDTEQQHLGRPYTACQQWRDGVLERIDQEQPDLVLLAGYPQPRTGGWRHRRRGRRAVAGGPRLDPLPDRRAPGGGDAGGPPPAERSHALPREEPRGRRPLRRTAGRRVRGLPQPGRGCRPGGCRPPGAARGPHRVLLQRRDLPGDHRQHRGVPGRPPPHLDLQPADDRADVGGDRAAGGVSSAGIARQSALAVRYRAEWAPVPPRARPSDQKEHHSWPEGCWSRARAEPPPR